MESAYSSSSEISALKERIENAELDAERIQQHELEKLIVPSIKKNTANAGESVLRGGILTNWLLLLIPGTIRLSAGILTAS